MAQTEFICEVCTKSFSRYLSTVKPGTIPSCSRSCAGKQLIGDKNPNFGNRWAAEQSLNLSKKTGLRFLDVEERFKVGSGNRGKKFSKERVKKMHAHRSKDSYSHAPSKERKVKIGKESAARWADAEYARNIVERGIATKIAKGSIIDPKLNSDWKIYWRLANWDRHFRYTEMQNLLALKMCRDHIVGRKQGFENAIFPEILKHPENCQLLSISDNSKKARRIPNSEATDALFTRILTYSGNYPKHHRAVELVNYYLAGGRWVRR